MANRKPKTERPYPGVWRARGEKFLLTINRQRKRHNYSGFKDARLTSRLREDILRALERFDAGEAIQTRGLNKRALEILADLGIIKGTSGQVELVELLDEYEQVLLSRENSKDYVKQAKSRIKKILEGCRYARSQDFDATEVQLFLKKLGHGKRTRNHYLRAAKGFVKFLMVKGRLHSDPLISLTMLNTEDDKRVVRRTLDEQEFEKLIKATTGHNKLPQDLRRMVFRIAHWTGFRAGEIGTLEVDCFELGSNPPVIVIDPTISKHRVEDRQVIPEFFAAELRDFLAGKQGKLFPGRWWKRAAEMLQVDLEAAGIPYKDAAGKQLDFHALRHSYVTSLAKAGVKPEVLQKLARHSTILLTLQVYRHVEEEETSTALEQALSGVRS